MARKYGTGIVIHRGANSNDVTWPTGHVEDADHVSSRDICRIAGIREDKLKHAARRERKFKEQHHFAGRECA